MRKSFLLVAFLLVGCNFEEDEALQYLPINPQELIYHKGDVLAFEIDSTTTGAAIVTNYSKVADDSTHIWYDLVCTDYTARQMPTIQQLKHHRLFGRKIESTLDPAGFSIGLDFESVRNDCFTDNAAKFHLVGQVPLDTTAIKMGSQGATEDYDQFVAAFLRGKKQRLLPPDHYGAYLSKMEKFRPDEYFPVTSFLTKQARLLN